MKYLTLDQQIAKRTAYMKRLNKGLWKMEQEKKRKEKRKSLRLTTSKSTSREVIEMMTHLRQEMSDLRERVSFLENKIDSTKVTVTPTPSNGADLVTSGTLKESI